MGKAVRFQGRIVDWHDEKGFGFVSPNGREERAFLHVKAFLRRSRRPVAGDLVTFTMTKDLSGRLRAEAAAFVRIAATLPRPHQRQLWRAPVGAVFLLAVMVMVACARIPGELAGVYLVASVVTFIAYAFDKSSARMGRQRTPEKTLQLMALLGGWPGALIGQQLLQHKTRKALFQAAFWFAVAANLALLLFFLSSTGSRFLSEMFSG